jgi:YggT family protein
MSPSTEPQRAVHQEASGSVLQEPVAAPDIQETQQLLHGQGGVERRERVVTDAAGGVEHRERVIHDVATEHALRIAKVCQLVWLCAGLVEVMIGLRVLLRLIGANPDNAFAGFAYNLASLFLAPFFGLVGSPAAGGSVLEVPSIIAMLVYAFVAWGVVRAVRLLFDRPMTRSSSTYDRSRV